MESNNSKQRPMKQYLEWIEKQIDFYLEDKTMQREHWAFCRAYEKFKSLETTTESEELTPHIQYYSNGNVSIKGQKNSVGQKEGIWEWFTVNGNIYWRTHYKEGEKDGIEEFFYSNRNIHWRIPYKGGKIEGILEEFYENGNIQSRTPFKDDEKDGIAEWFDKQGNIIKTYVWKNGELIEETKPELTPYIEYHPNGNVWIKGQLNSKGQEEGIWERFYENGNIYRITPYVEGKIVGIVEWFYENGNIRVRTPYKNNEIDGIEEEFDEQGNILSRTPYKDGEIDGIEELFDEEGNITETRVWKDGELIETTKH